MNAPYTPARHKLTVEDFHRMGEAGILREDSRIEFIDGELIDMAPIGSVHASVVTLLTELFIRQAGGASIVLTQNPILLPPDSEPQPDVALVKPRADRYRAALPSAADIFLVVEVSDSTVDYDRGTKVPLYARHGIQEVWLFDLRARSLEIYLEPLDAGYRTMLRPSSTEVVSPQALASICIPLEQIWQG